ncbi:CAL67264 family membrane protein [Flavobacterium saliperosum]|nr:CAL67264 family membrane protein [Flavobacterium saliperosum]
MNKNTVLGWATLIMIVMGIIIVGLGVYRYDDVAGWGFGAVGIGFFAIAWVFNALKGRV